MTTNVPRSLPLLGAVATSSRHGALLIRARQWNCNSILRALLGAAIVVLASCTDCFSQSANAGKVQAKVNDPCPRAAEGAAAEQPYDLRSTHGVLRVSLTIRSSVDANGHARYCYLDALGHQAPTLRVHPGDMLYLRLKNEISISPAHASSDRKSTLPAQAKNNRISNSDPCSGGPMHGDTTNLHFHGLAIPAVCHQDETLRTAIEPGDPPFEYRIQISRDQPPGLYWYHPHVHGFSEEQLLGGASGALVVEGIENAVPRVAGLPEHVFVIRDEKMPEATAVEKPDPNRPTKQLSINYVPVTYPEYTPALIKMKPQERQFWRVLNASADTYVDLYVVFAGKRQSLILIALDGVPLHYGERGSEEYSPQVSDVFLPPASRAEFVVTGPADGVSGKLMTSFVYRGSDDDAPAVPRGGAQPGLRIGQDDVDAARPLASIVASEQVTGRTQIPSTPSAAETRPAPLSGVRPVRKRTLYFSEKLSDPADPNSSTLFFITEQGHAPAVFDPRSMEPSITVRQGDVEDWTIENRSRESHTFHIHQLHFLVIGSNGNGWEEATLRDTVNVRAWDGFRKQYPSITLRMDFRDPHITGTIPFHCHIAQHLDGGMMGTVRVEPASTQ